MKRIYTLLTSLFVLVTSASWAQQATAIVFQPNPASTNSLTINWTNGTGVGRIVVVKNSTGTWKPVNGANITTLNANVSFTAGTNDQDAGSGVAAVVFAGAGSGPVTVTNLVSGTPYFVQVYEFTGTTASPVYVLTNNSTNPKGFSFYSASNTFNAPQDVTSITVQAWGGGGGGGGATNSTNGRAGGGGGGAAYNTGVATVTAGATGLAVTVGAGGAAGDGAGIGSNGGSGGSSTFGSVTAVGGNGGETILGAATDRTGNGGAATATGTFNGGAGGEGTPNGNATGSATGSGGGGGSPGISGNGSNGTAAANTGGAGGTGGGAAGADGGNTGNGTNGTNGNFPGSGGSGGWDKGNTADRTGGTGGGGLVILSYNDNTAPLVTSINRQTPASSPANATTVTFQVTFNEPVTNVTFDDFANGGTAGAGTISVSPVSSSVYNVQISGLSSGTVDLNFGSNDIVDLSNNAFAGTVNSEQTYTLDNVAPTISTAVASPSTGLLKIGDQVVITLTAGGAETGLVAGAGSTVNGQAATFNEVGGGTYTFTYTIASTNANWAAGALPFNLILNDGVNNSTAQTTFTTANTMAGDANAPTNQNTIFPTSRAATPGGSVTLVAGTATDFNFLAPTGTTNFVANGTTITSVAGNATSITAPTTEGDYQLFVVDAAGNYSAASTATLSVFTQASNLTFGAAGTPASQINLNWTGGSGDGRVIVIKAGTVVGGGNYPLATGFDPAPAVISLALGANNSATDLNAGATGVAQVVFEGNTAGPITVTGLAGNTVYVFEVYEYKNNGASRVYLNPAITASRSTPNGSNPAPATPINFAFTNITGTSIDVQFSQGTGASSVLVARAANPVSGFTLTDGVSYTPNLDYTAGTDLGSGHKVIAYRLDAASGTPISVTGLNPDVVYHFAVFDMNGTQGNGSENYSAVSTLGNRNTEPSTLATPQSFTGVGETTMTLNWTNTGDGDKRLVVMRPNNAITASEYPTDYTTYTTSSNFNFGSPTGTAIGAGYVVYDGTGTSVSLTNLLPGTTYHFAIFEYNNTTSQGAPNQVFLTPGATASQATNGDATPPAPNTVGALTPGPASPGSRVVAGYWNSTNTTLTVNVPLAATDGTLDGGTIQIQVQNVLNTGFVNVPNSGLYTILPADRAFGSKNVVVNKADLILAVSGATGYTEGSLGGAALDPKRLEVTAVVNDLAGNSRTYAQSVSSLDVDTTPPAITGTVNLYSNAGLGASDQNHEVVQFELNEDITLADDATALSTNTNGAAGFYISGTLKTGDSKYQSDGTPNVDAFFNGKRAIYLESSGNTDGWSTSTALIYTQQSSFPGSGNFVRDAAGNEMGAVNTNLTSGGTSTTLGTSTGVAVASPIINGATNQVVFAFSLTSTGAVNLTSLSISTTVSSIGLLKNFKLFSSTTTDAFGSASNLSLTPTVTASSVDFGLPGNTLSVGLTATPRYFYLVADVENYFLSSGPTIQFSVNTGNLNVSTGGRTGGPITGTNYTLQDNTAPSILSITNTVNPIFEGALTQTVTVVYSEPMNTATNPAITASGANWGASTPSGGTNGWFTTTLPNDSYKATLVHNGTQELNATATASVAALANGTDWGNNKNAAGASSASSFVLDTQKPTATLTATTTATSNKLVNLANLALTVQVTYGEAMNTSVAPAITLNPSNTNFTAGAGVWSGGNTIYTIVYTHNGSAEEIASTQVSANGGKDANGNTQTAAAATSGATNIVIDTQRPIVSSITRNNPQFTNGPSVSYTVVFNEVVSGVSETDFTPVAINGTVSTGTIFPGGVSNPLADNKTFVVVVQGLTGDGDARLDVVNGTATIVDANGNSFNATFNSGEIYSIDNTKPTVVSITVDPAVINSYAATVNGVTPSLHGNTVDYIVTFSEKVNNVDPDFLDFSGLKAPNAGSTINVDPGSITPVGGAPATTWRVSALYNNGAGTFELDFNPSSNNTTAPFTIGTGAISVNNGAGQINNAGGANFTFELNPGYDIYINGNEYVGTVQCCITGAKFNLESPAVVTSGSFTGPFSFDSAPTLVGSGAGSITASTGSNIITGIGTAFKSNLKKNDILLTGPSGNYIGTVQSVTSNTSIQITLAGAHINYSGSYFIKRPSTAPFTSTIADQAGNIIVPSTFLAGTYYNFCLNEPLQAPALSSTATPTSIKATWTDVSGATGYLVMLRDNVSGPAFSVVADGTYFNDVTDFTSSGVVLTKNVSQGIGSATFDGLPTSLTSGKVYQVTIYPYSLDPNTIIGTDKHAINYNTTVVPAATITPSTTTGSTTTIASVPVPGASPLSSLVDDAPAGQSQNVFAFKITDDGSGNNDNAPTKFSQIVIRQSGGSISDWTQALGTNQAELVASSGGPAITGTVANISPGVNTITFNIPNRSNPSDFGFISDGANKDYTLRIWLKTSLGGTLPVTIDGASFGFSVTAADIALDNTTNNQQSSKFLTVPVQTVNSPLITVAVSATVMTFNTNLPATIGVKATFPTPPVVEAKDANGNRDTNGYVAATAYTITLGGTLTTSSGTDNWAAGILTLNNFNFTSPGTGNITISAAGITTPAISDSNSGLGGNQTTQAVITGLSQVSAVASSEPATISSLGTIDPALVASAPQTIGVQNWSFTITDDVGATALTNDKLPTIINSISITRNNFNGATGGADALTFDDWTTTIAGAQLSLGANKVNGAVNAGSLDFTLPAAMQTVADDGSNTYVLKIWLKNPVATALQSIIDGKDYVFDVVATPSAGVITGPSPTSSTMQASTASSLDGKNVVDVQATKLIITNNLNATQSYDATLSPIPTGETVDVNGNRDLNYNIGVSATAAGNPGTVGASYPLDTSPTGGTVVSISNGLLTFAPTVRVKSSGNGLNNDAAKITITSGSLVSATSNSFILNYSGNSDVIKDPLFVSGAPSVNTYTQNILYANYQSATFGASSSPASIGVALERFQIRDGGAGHNDSDGTPTTVQNIKLNLQNAANIRAIALYNGSTFLAEQAVNTGNINYNSATGDLNFPSLLAFSAPDNGDGFITIYATFNATVTDNQILNVKVVSITAGGVSSSFVGGGTTTNFAALGANDNQIEVVATRVDFTTQPSPTAISTYTDINSPYIVVEARDANANTDFDYTGAIGTISNSATTGTAGGSQLIMANKPTGNFVLGKFDFQVFDNAQPIGSKFQFNEDSGLEPSQLITMTVAASGLTSGTSNPFKVIGSYDSWLYFDPTFTYTNQIDFIPYTNTTTSNASFALGRLILSDGGYAAGVKNATTHADSDGAFTKITNLTLSIPTNNSDIAAIGLYTVGGTKIDEVQNPGTSVLFTNLASYPAQDDQIITYVVRAEFKTAIIDQHQITMKIGAVTANSGSKFPEFNPIVPTATIGGVAGGDAPTTGHNFLNVIATSLDFTTQPSAFAGINEPIGINPLTTKPYGQGNGPTFFTDMPTTTAGIVTARDKFANIDKGFSPATIEIKDAANTPLGNPNTFNFTSGVMDLTGMVYPQVGNGAVKIITTGPSIDSSVPPGSNIGNSKPSNPVDVLHVNVTQDTNGTVPSSNLPPTASLKGGLTSQNIFGLKFTATNTSSAEPKLKGFTIDFKDKTGAPQPYESNGSFIFKNLQIYYNGVVNNITSIGGTFTKSSSTGSLSVFDRIVVDLNAQPQSVPTTGISFFLVVDVDANTNTGTPAITPYFKDSGWGNPNDQNAIVSYGTAKGDFFGTEYSFASTKPPVLQADNKKYPNTKTSPFAGQSNVSPFINTITLQFDASVGSLDGGNMNGATGNAELWDRNSNKKVADLVLNTSILVTPAPPLIPTTGQKVATVSLQNTIAEVYSSLIFDIKNGPASLKNDSVYFVKIAQGSYDPNTNIGRGISDYGLNFFGGITDNSTLYFKIASNQNIKLSSIKSTFNTPTIGTLTTTFDQLGTAYFLIVNAGSTTPTVSEVNGTTTYTGGTIGAKGKYTINSISTAQTHTFPATFIPGQNYDVYLFAENNALPNAVPALGIYDSNLAAGGSSGPTLNILGTSILANQATSTPNNPNYVLCPDSYVTLPQPMIIGETATFQFSKSGDQDFNILLPTGFQFDVTVAPDVKLIGSDFKNLTTLKYGTPSSHPTWEYQYKSNTLVNIRFNNTTSASQDFISISGFSIIGKVGSPQASIDWFFGDNVFTDNNKSVFTLAQIGLLNGALPNFTNSYWLQNAPFITSDVTAAAYFKTTVNAIPDNYQDLNNPGAIRLLPMTAPYLLLGNPDTFAKGDYLASFFSGNGVSGDLLTLSSVTKGAAFNISMLHTDLNGCITNKQQQYLVYDHNSPISKKLGVTLNYSVDENNLSSPTGTKQDIVNTNFPGTSTSIVSPKLGPNELAGYTLKELSVDLPKNALTLSSQIPMSGPKWSTLVKTKVLKIAAAPTYTWDYSEILKADNTVIGSGLNDVYDYFKTKVTPPSGNIYWTGGSLGKVQFSGTYNSTADNSVYVPFKQDVELFVPAVPLIEVTSPAAFNDPSDLVDLTVTPNFKTGRQYPNGYLGTATFCEFGGTITLNAFPTPAGGQSTGSFKLYDYKSYSTYTKLAPTSGIGTLTSVTGSTTVVGVGTNFTTLQKGTILYDAVTSAAIGVVETISNNTNLILTTGAASAVTSGFFKFKLPPTSLPIPSAAFVDNGNGTMTLDPTDSVVINNYDNLLVTYTYQENNSPAVGIGYLVIRVTPNPVVKFTIASTVAGPGLKGAASPVGFCLGNEITFDASPSTITQPTGSTPPNSIANYQWNFGDPNSASLNTATGPVGVADKPVHTYNSSSIYTANLSLTSNWGCPSIPSVTSVPRTIQANNILYAGSKGDITVGEIPIVDFSFIGNCVGDDIIFTDNSSTSGNATAGTKAKFIWNFGDATPAFTGYNTLNPPPTPPFNFPNSPDGRVDVKHTYSSANFYSVTLSTITSLGCTASTTKSLAQLPVKSPTQQTAFFEDFDDNGGWLTLDLNGSSPVSNANGGISPWTYTGGKWTIPGNYQANKKSALYSACLDLSGVPRPVISFRSNLNLSDGEGIVLQYSKDSKNIQDPGKAWSVLGTTPDETSNPSPGIEWYNKAGLASNPGTGYANSSNAKGYGWSGKPGRSEPKHKLEDITNPQNPLPNNRVILRFAFSSLNAGGNGITIDSVRVGSRTRTILFENFTTTDIGSAPSALNDVLKSEADSIRKFTNANINSTQLVNINYHVDFLGKDPFNALNEADQGSRALYYNVNQVPYAFLDGVHNQYKNSSDLFQNWGQGAYDLQTLNLANADFRIASNPTKVTTNNTDGTIEVEVNVTPTKDLPKSTKLFVAVLEDQILKGQLPGTPSITTGETEFNYVLRKMLPNAVGTRYPDGTFKSGTSVRLGANGKVNAAADKFTWSVNKVFGSKLSVVVFLQDSTKGVYQADLFQNVAIPSNLITGIEPLSPERVNIYPNPANQEFTIELPKALSVDANVSLVDQMGRTLDGGLIPAGRTNKSVGTYELAAGVYIVQIKTDGGEVVRKKVVIVH